MVQGITGTETARVAFTQFEGTEPSKGGKSPAKDSMDSCSSSSQTWGECLCSPFVAVWNGIKWCAESLICVLTLGFFCNTKEATPAEVKKAIADTVEVLKKDGAKDEEKAEAIKTLFANHKGLEAEAKTAYAEAQRKDNYTDEQWAKRSEDRQQKKMAGWEKAFDEAVKANDPAAFDAIAKVYEDKAKPESPKK